MSFEREVQIAIDKITDNAEQFVKFTNLEIFSAIIGDTPVDTGRARGNWQTSQDTPAGGEVGRVQKEKTGPATQEAETALLTGFGLFWLSNNLPYAERLEYGWSKQAPNGMVRKNAARIRQHIKTAAGKVK